MSVHVYSLQLSDVDTNVLANYHNKPHWELGSLPAGISVHCFANFLSVILCEFCECTFGVFFAALYLWDWHSLWMIQYVNWLSSKWGHSVYQSTGWCDWLFLYVKLHWDSSTYQRYWWSLYNRMWQWRLVCSSQTRKLASCEAGTSRCMVYFYVVATMAHMGHTYYEK